LSLSQTAKGAFARAATLSLTLLRAFVATFNALRADLVAELLGFRVAVERFAVLRFFFIAFSL
jgi:hypothetical protein